MASARSTRLWTDKETRFMLHQIQKLNIFKFMDGRKTKNANLFKKIKKEMADAGFIRTPEQIKIKWKHIRLAYIGAKQNNSSSAHDPVSCPYYDILDDLLGSRPLSQAAADQEAATEMGGESTAAMVDATEMGSHDDSTGSTTQHGCDAAETLRSSSPLQRNSELPETSAQRPRRRRQGHTGHVALICEQMGEMRDFWREQLRERDERQERLLTTYMEGTNNMFAAILEEIRSLWPLAPPIQHKRPHGQ
ncbi:myb/SANT-like DNA-binding domain-containing protein 7 [Cololabis saira]|uniref:myb/SANT-like DNA-binding domain-containing protein 7 n=1 Tax=Cololabis saira TaxID=129043 RepID=UPI002AD2091F|nr:myb/SANT-like DNA-binding domain-containing protein 7 [Cololabis saira]